jgi:triosephosphate isomerase
MERDRTFLIANWKMNPGSVAEARSIFRGIRDAASRAKKVQTVVCPPFPFLSELRSVYSGKKISFGAQDLFWEQAGSYTGEVSGSMLASLGAQYVIIGHSERRKLGETDDVVNKKVRAGCAANLKTVLCVGESERDAHGEYLTFVRDQLRAALSNVNKADLLSIVVAYEPVWAIGKSAKDAMQPEDVHQMVIYVRKIIAELYTPQLAYAVPVLYGGSVEPGNIESLMQEGHANGFLVGHASLVPTQFTQMITTLNSLA